MLRVAPLVLRGLRQVQRLHVFAISIVVCVLSTKKVLLLVTEIDCSYSEMKMGFSGSKNQCERNHDQFETFLIFPQRFDII